MFNQKRQSVRLPDAREMSVALSKVRAIQNDHDARLMLLVFLDRAALMGRNLKALGLETDDSLKSLFDSALEQSKRPLAKVPTTFDPTVTPESGKAS